MPIDTYQIADVQLTDSVGVFKNKLNEVISIVNGLPASRSGTLTRLGGTIDGLTTGIPATGDDGTLYLIQSGAIALGDFLGEDEPTTAAAELHVRRVPGVAQIIVDANTAAGKPPGGTANVATLLVRDAGGSNNYVKISSFPDYESITSPVGSGRDSAVPIIAHHHLGDGTTHPDMEMIRIERQSDGLITTQASYVSYRLVTDTAGGTYDHVRLAARHQNDDDGIFEIWVADAGTPAPVLEVHNDITSLLTGNLDVRSGNVDIRNGNLSIWSGNVEVRSGNVDIQTGNVNIWTGGLGIGTNAPVTKLDVRGTLSATDDATFAKNVEVTTANVNIHTGGLGIGTNAPVTKLDVQGTARTTGTLRVEDATAATDATDGALYVEGGIASGDALHVTSDISTLSGNVEVQTANLNVWAGGVGVGTNAPVTKLDVRGTLSATDDATFAKNVEVTTANVNIHAGGLGVGTNAPVMDADIAGTLRATENVTLASGSTTSNVSVGGVLRPSRLTVNGAIALSEQASSQAGPGTHGAYGQLWVKNSTPNELWFTDDAGNDFGPLGQMPSSLSSNYYAKEDWTPSLGVKDVHIAHGKSTAPKIFVAYLQCATPDRGWGAGDMLPLATNGRPPAADAGIVPYANTGYVGYTQRDKIEILNKGGITSGQITYANWKIIIRAWF